jgi:Tfp pilus assembly protein PilO
MKRMQLLLTIVAAILLVVLFWLLLWQPKQDRIATTREEITLAQDQQRLLEAEVARLRSVREQAPEAEALLAAAGAIVPEGSALPSLLRQMQTAADDAGLVLQSVNVGRPPDELPAGASVASLPVNGAIEGTYFQIADFLRRLEQPAISPRGLLWDSMTISPGEYPTLNAVLTGRTFAASVGPTPGEAEEPAIDEGSDPDAEVDVEVDADVDVEVEQ